tara:strand:+ start:521 stop:646 length:126 start_codon:yes stop_codon:yes gene_type:complete
MEILETHPLNQNENVNMDTNLKNVINYLSFAHPNATEIIGN